LSPSVQHNNDACYVCPARLPSIPFSSTLATNIDSSFLNYHVLTRDGVNYLNWLPVRLMKCLWLTFVKTVMDVRL